MKQLFTLTLAGLLLAGCRKPDALDCGPVPQPAATTPTTPTAPSPPTSAISLSGFFAKYGAPLQRRGFLIGQTTPIRTAGGAALAVAGVTFLDDNNTAVQDSAYLYLREVYRVPDMVLSDMPTTSRAGQLLISGGEFYTRVQARSGRRLHVSAAGTVANGAALPVWQSPIPPEQDSTRQRFWQMPYLGAGWALNSSVAVQTVFLGVSSGLSNPNYQARIPLDTIPYSNIDQLWRAYQGATAVPINVAAPAGTDTRVLLRPVGYNGLYRAAATTASGSATTTWYAATLPAGASLKAVVLQSIGGQLYVGSQVFTVQSGALIAPTLTAVSEADAVAFIQAL